MAWRALSKNLQELRIHLCQTSKGSEGVRDFIKTTYTAMKKDNPTFPILIRECSGVEAKVWARYDLGKEAGVKVENMTAADIKTQLQGLIEKGATMPRAQ